MARSLIAKGAMLCAAFILASLTACGSSDGNGVDTPTTTPTTTPTVTPALVATYTIGGSVSGLGSGQTVTLKNNGADAKVINANGNFSFTTPVAHGSGYNVTISTQPLDQVCSIASGSGSNVVANVSSVSVSCRAPNWEVSTVAGGGAGGNGVGSTNGTGTAALFNFPHGITIDSGGNLYVADAYNYKIRKITPAGEVSTVAGGGAGGNESGSSDGTGTAAKFNTLTSITIDSGGYLYVTDLGNHKIRKITPAGVVSTVAGGGAGGNEYGSTNGTGTAAKFSDLSGITIDSGGNLYVADAANNKIRKITPAGVVSTVAGGGAVGNEEGNSDGTGTAALFYSPNGITIDSDGNLYVADTKNHKIRKINPAGVVSTVAGGGAGGNEYGSTNGTGAAALFDLPIGITIDSGGKLYVADARNNKIRKILKKG